MVVFGRKRACDDDEIGKGGNARAFERFVEKRRARTKMYHNIHTTLPA